MKRVHPNECIPAAFRNGLVEIESDKDLKYLGKENLACLTIFWEDRKDRFSKKLSAETDLDKRDKDKLEIEQCDARLAYLKSLIPSCESKPVFFAKPIYSVGIKVAYFVADLDCYAVGTIVRIDRDEKTGIGTFTIRVYDKNTSTKSHDVKYTPDGFSMFLADDLTYYRAHPEYFRYVLNYLAKPSNPTEIDYVDCLVAALD